MCLRGAFARSLAQMLRAYSIPFILLALSHYTDTHTQTHTSMAIKLVKLMQQRQQRQYILELCGCFYGLNRLDVKNKIKIEQRNAKAKPLIRAISSGSDSRHTKFLSSLAQPIECKATLHIFTPLKISKSNRASNSFYAIFFNAQNQISNST